MLFQPKRRSLYENFVTSSVKTNKGISWTLQPDEVLKAYGKPKKDFKNDSGNNARRRIEYDGIDFLFEFGELKRNGIHAELD